MDRVGQQAEEMSIHCQFGTYQLKYMKSHLL